jgi:hypothetical protein
MRQTAVIAHTPLDSPRAFRYVPALPALANCQQWENLSETARPLRGLMDLGPRAIDGRHRSPGMTGASLVP